MMISPMGLGRINDKTRKRGLQLGWKGSGVGMGVGTSGRERVRAGSRRWRSFGFWEKKIETKEMVNIVLLVNQCSCL
jgi:hypothetical protein